MKCTTVRVDVECPFMTAKGCNFLSGELPNQCQPVAEQCKGCDHIIKIESGPFAGEFCNTFPDPAFKWSSGYCNFATHVKQKVEEQKKINPLKLSKLKARGG
jgi:hypothetical protein